jgi:acyl carrier protein
MDREQLKQKLRKLLEESTDQKYERFDDDQNIRTDLGLDSVDMVSLVLDVQGMLSVQLSIVDLEQVVTIGQLLDLLLARLSAPARRAA